MPDPDPSRRPSRRGWPLRTQPTTTPAGTHQHELPRWIRIVVIGFGVALLLILGVMSVDVVHQQSLHEFRDKENARLHEQIREGMCDLLDQLPQSPVLDGPRRKYHCGPGIPLEDLPPAVRRRWSGTTTVVPTPSPAAPTTRSSSSSVDGAQPGAPPAPDAAPAPTRPAPSSTAAPTHTPAPSPSASASRTSALGLLCQLVDVCLPLP